MKVLQITTDPDPGENCKLTRVAIETEPRIFTAYEGQHKDKIDEVRLMLIAAVGRKLSEQEASPRRAHFSGGHF